MNWRKGRGAAAVAVPRSRALTTELFQLVVESVADYAIFVLDPAGRIQTWNRGAEDIHGYAAEEIIGKHFSIFYPPQEVQRRKPEYELAMASTEDRYEDEGWRIRKNGSRFWANVVITALYQDAKLVGFAKVVRDLTEMKQAEDERSQLLRRERKAREDAERSLQQLGVVQEVTEAALSLLSLNDLLRELLERISRMISVDSARILLLEENELVVRAAKGKEETAEQDIRIPLGRGFAGRIAAERRPIAVFDPDQAEIDDPVLGQRGMRSLLGVPLIVQDRVIGVLDVGSLTGRQFREEEILLLQVVGDRVAMAVEHARLNEAIRAAESQRLLAESQVERRDAFLSVAAHELKTPLTSLYGLAQLLERRLDKGELTQESLKDALSKINRQGSKLVQLLNQLLDISRLDAPGMALTEETVDLSALARETAQAFQANSPNHRFEVEVQEGIQVRGDDMRLEQVLINLLENAVKFSPDGGAIDVAVRLVPDKGVEVSVRDHGVGVPPEHRPHIFNRFYQADRRSYRIGLGLGLFLSRQIVELHGGQLDAEFPPDGGSRFVARLPADRLIACRPEPDGVTVASERGAILVIDDDESIRALVQSALSEEGYSVLTAANGLEALGMLRHQAPRLILLDMRMPVMDGWEFARVYSQSIQQRAPILVMTAASDAMQRAREIGAEGHISKPFDLSDLVDTVAAHARAESSR